MRKFLTASVIAVAALCFAAPAGAFPPGEVPAISCDEVSIDPPPMSYIRVTFAGTINDVPYSRTVSYGAPTPHIARADISDLTTATGPLTITATATSEYLGTSETATVTLTCHEPPQTSTTAPSTSTTVLTPPTTSMVPPDELPQTGTSLSLAAFGVGFVAVGAAAMAARRRSIR